MNIEEIKNVVKSKLSEERYYHSLCVMERGKELAKIYGADEQKAILAGITHDIAKEMSKKEKIEYAEQNGLEIDEIERDNPGLLHGKIAAHICKEKFGFSDDILDAIQYHTTGKENMSLLTKIIFISDSTGKDREYEDVEYLRKLSEKDLNAAIIYNLDYILNDNIKKGKLIHLNTINARNFLLKK